MPNSPRADAVAHYEPVRSSIEYVPRRLRKGLQTPPADGAGLLNATRNLVRPAKGKGAPPPDEREWEFRTSKHFVPSSSFKSQMNTVLNHNMSSTVPESAAKPVGLRLSERSYLGNLMGGGVSVAVESPQHKPMKRPGTAAPAYRTDRVFGMVPASNRPEEEHQYALVSTARRDVFVNTGRPSTAPACVLVGKKTLSRTGYDLSRAAHDDVVRYRHSGGICPAEYKLSTERPAAPQRAAAAAPTPESKASFFAARSSYQVNRARGHMSDILMGHA
ncbi:hypothetical protein CHLRE_12g528800v5 [Chlamydomonas reinhardtii]|uniref:Uncharacterized protein n=1 Tax=Chlamydomonas reinhardtii TaxID=3055 RepID=A8J596_CHLRE|nr:uncharacterized protein CHLRE_12g528800v5 [Chlamydomonas reinhardtii]PNW75490.1 hypothetical protein CHLRE_12g528800v5 [Chlamydomonas reinhardtii]|eukprot:XP_001696861.1 predicted protein [Chlamydomonas reinhardtii]